MKSNTVPRHIAIIMDGNGRWAKKRLLPRSMGHREGVKTIDRMSEAIFDRGVKYLTLYAFSTENWKRPETEVRGLFELFKKYVRKNLPRMLKKKICFRVYGDTTAFDGETKEMIADAEAKTGGGDGGTLGICFNYGGRTEIVRAAQSLAGSGALITEESLSAKLYTGGIPDPDIVIRTGGEHRLSNFLLYQAAYSEIFFVDALWPDFSEKELDEILEKYNKTERRYGSIKE